MAAAAGLRETLRMPTCDQALAVHRRHEDRIPWG